ncbi:hypothetical protein [Nissabacter sp. SGAir0207]|uniref:hypothetical protein n=1 Tax=Nissabacter sp. SGAir0207 TaxID=2126321 RepID=UPI0010F8A5AC|nr:hypothetical protein [Nissabacter sp. SGAir0207]
MSKATKLPELKLRWANQLTHTIKPYESQRFVSLESYLQVINKTVYRTYPRGKAHLRLLALERAD